MLGRMAKRIFHAVVLFFAIYAFVFVPLGKKTALEHVRAIFGTREAKQAAAEVKGGVQRLARRLRSEAREVTERTDDELDDKELDTEGEPESADEPASAEEETPRSRAKSGAVERRSERSERPQRVDGKPTGKGPERVQSERARSSAAAMDDLLRKLPSAK
jgi:hypothetical protein